MTRLHACIVKVRDLRLSAKLYWVAIMVLTEYEHHSSILDGLSPSCPNALQSPAHAVYHPIYL